MATIIRTGGGHGEMKVSNIAVGGAGDTYSNTIDTGGTATKKLWYALSGIKEFSHQDVYVRVLGSNDGSSWDQIVRTNAMTGAYSEWGANSSINTSYRFYKIHCHRQSGGDRAGGMIAVMEE